jgi:hypothetical protein
VEELRASTKNKKQNRMGKISLQGIQNCRDRERQIGMYYRKGEDRRADEIKQTHRNMRRGETSQYREGTM